MRRGIGGRPKIPAEKIAQVKALLYTGQNITAVAHAVGLSHGSLRRIADKMGWQVRSNRKRRIEYELAMD